MAPDDRRYPRHPLVGVGAIILERDRVLMAQRGKQPQKGRWSLPGGLLELGETLADAQIGQLLGAWRLPLLMRQRLKTIRDKSRMIPIIAPVP